MDKTGTLTSNRMTVVRAAAPTSAGVAAYAMPSASGLIQDAQKRPLADPAAVQGLLYLALCSSVCNNSTLAQDVGAGPGARHVGDSTEVALRLFAERVGLPASARVRLMWPLLCPESASAMRPSSFDTGSCSQLVCSTHPLIRAMHPDTERLSASIVCSHAGWREQRGRSLAARVPATRRHRV